MVIISHPNSELDLFKLGQHYFDTLIQEFAAYGIHTEPGLELRRGTGMLCYYDLNDGHIYLAVPDMQAPEGKFQLLLWRSLLSCVNNEELLDLFHLLLPFAIAHELAHYFRQRYGLFTDNLWYEEQIANQLAAAVTKHRLAPAQRERVSFLLKRAIEGLANKLGVQDAAADSYRSIWQAFGIGGQIAKTERDYMQLTQRMFAIDPADVLKSNGQLSEEISQRLARRESIIDEINVHYASDYVRYLYFQLGWICLELTSPERQYVATFAQQHLGLNVPTLPLIPEEPIADENAILACFKAYLEALPHSETGSRYFYKRYRSLLLTYLQSAAQVGQFHQQFALILQTWDGQAGGADMLAGLSYLAPPPMQRLFPHQIVQHPQLRFVSPQDHLPTETDRRLWAHICLGKEDPGAGNFLSCLTVLDHSALYGVLPAEVMLELSHSFCRIKLAAGETIIWRGERNDDVYILIEGKLGVFDYQGRALAVIDPGQVFGEMTFFTDAPRHATVRAIEKSECSVLKGIELRILAFKYPVILMHIARTLTGRLAEMNENVMYATTWQSPAVHLETLAA